MAVDQDQRPSFYQGQYLGPEDLTAAVDYGRIQMARHSLGGHTWGIAIGMDLIEKPSPAGNNAVDMFLTPGFAWDGFGRFIVVLTPYKVPVSLFQNITFNAQVDDPKKSGDNAPGHLVNLWLRYNENPNQPPAAGFQVCDASGATSRVQETFSLEIGDFVNPSDLRDPVSIGGKLMDALQALITFGSANQLFDTSVPQQALPEDDAEAQWLIPVGKVRWLPPNPPQAGGFQQRTPDDLKASERVRQYIGVVASAVEAAGNNIHVKLRSNPPSAFDSTDLLWVEGSMHVEGSASLFGGSLSFLDNGGKDDGVPLLIQRVSQIDPATNNTLTSLQVEIGTSNQGNNTFSIGPLANNNFVPVFTVLDSGKAGVGTTKPRNPLGVRASGGWEELLSFEDPAGNTKWHLNQNPNGNNSGLNFSETNVADFRLFIQAGGNVGLGTSAPTNRLHVDDILGIRQRYLYLSGDAGWSSLTYNAHHDSRNQNWVFPDQAHSAVTIEMDDELAGNVARFEVWTTPSSARTNWIQRLAINGDTGDTYLVHHGGNLGVGTTAPATKLHVVGGDLMWGNHSRLQVDQGGSIELGGDNATPGTGVPYIDFHFGNGLTQDFNTRIINDADGQLSLFAQTVKMRGNVSVAGARTYLLGLDNQSFHWIMAGGMTEGTNNALGFQYTGVPGLNLLHTGPGWIKGFLIHHPLDPGKKYLAHATLEGPEAAVFYRGEAHLTNGKATIHLPDFFEALTLEEDRTILLTPLSDDDDPVSHLAASPIKKGAFTVRGTDQKNPSQPFYWEVKAVRADVARLALVVNKKKDSERAAAPSSPASAEPVKSRKRHS